MNLESESLSEEDIYPIIYEDMPFYNLELTGLSRISFAVADDPFYRTSRVKYYPEVYLINKKSKIQAVINPLNHRSNKYKDAFEYCEDFREQALKVNDDRKVRINLSELMKGSKPGKMILLTVRTNSLRQGPPKNGEFDRAWFRLINEDTNQTVDYKNIKEIQKPEGFDEDGPLPESEDGAANSEPPQIIYVAGRLFLDDNNRWVYESYNNCFTTDKYPNLVEKIAEIFRTGEEDLNYQKGELENVKHRLL